MKKLLVLLILIVALVVTGCAEQASESSESTNAVSLPDEDEGVDATSAIMENTSTLVDDVEKLPELKIMSVTVEDGMLTMKIKNIGNAPAVDVYAGVIGVDQYPNYVESELALYHGYNQAIVNTLYNSILLGSDYIDTGFALEYEDYTMQSLKISSNMINKDYLGEISPGELVESSSNIYEAHGWYAKVVWMDGHEDDFVAY